MIEFTLNRNRNGKKSRWANKFLQSLRILAEETTLSQEDY